jgi:hypothetical protein
MLKLRVGLLALVVLLTGAQAQDCRAGRFASSCRFRPAAPPT